MNHLDRISKNNQTSWKSVRWRLSCSMWTKRRTEGQIFRISQSFFVIYQAHLKSCFRFQVMHWLHNNFRQIIANYVELYMEGGTVFYSQNASLVVFNWLVLTHITREIYGVKIYVFSSDWQISVLGKWFPNQSQGNKCQVRLVLKYEPRTAMNIFLCVHLQAISLYNKER